MTPAARLPSLDVLRAVAIVLVLGRHALFLANWNRELLPSHYRPALDIWYRGGWVGIDLFFVLSGFLVAGLLFRDFQSDGRLSVGRFLVRRAFKIYPAYYALLAFTAAVVSLTRPGPFPVWPFVREALFVQNYLPAVWDHTWSLAIEEHFYLLLPLVLLAMRAARPNDPDPFRPLPYVYLAVMLGALAWRIVLASQLPSYRHYQHAIFLIPTHLRIDSLFLGAALAYLYHFRREWVDRQLNGRAANFLIFGVLSILPAFVFHLDSHAMMYTVGFPIVALGSACLLAGVLAGGVPDNAFVRTLAFVGRHSYAIYLWHLAVAAWGIAWLQLLTGKLSLEIKIPLYFVLSLAVGIALSYAIERPFLWLRDRYFPSRSAAAK